MKDKLVEKLIGSDVRAFEQIVKKYGRYVFRVVKNHSKGLLSREDEEEITNDTFAALWLTRERIDPERPLLTYLAVIARNKVSNSLRTLKFTVSIEQLGELCDADFDSKLEDKENVDAILEAAGTLNKKQYEVFVRFYLYGEPLTEISAQRATYILTSATKERRSWLRKSMIFLTEFLMVNYQSVRTLCELG